MCKYFLSSDKHRHKIQIGFSIYIYKRLCPRKKIRNRKKERATETLNLKLNTKPLKFKCGLADRGGGGGWSTHARDGYPHLVINKERPSPQNNSNVFCHLKPPRINRNKLKVYQKQLWCGHKPLRETLTIEK